MGIRRCVKSVPQELKCVRETSKKETADLSTTLRSGRDDKFVCAIDLSSRPERTRISCPAAPDTTTCAAFIKESRMKLASATNLNRKSGVA
jgi:hypothetical protein